MLGYCNFGTDLANSFASTALKNFLWTLSQKGALPRGQGSIDEVGMT